MRTKCWGLAHSSNRINVNDPQLITLVNKLQDVFTTVGVSLPRASRGLAGPTSEADNLASAGSKPNRSAPNSSGGIAVEWKEFGTGEHSRKRFVGQEPKPEDVADTGTSAYLEGPASSRDDHSYYNLSIELPPNSPKRTALMAWTRRRIKKPTSTSGANFCTFLVRNSSTSIRSETKLSKRRT